MDEGLPGAGEEVPVGTRTIVPATALAILVALALAPAALAVSASVRVEGASHQVMPMTWVDVRSAGGPVVDTAGHTYAGAGPTPLCATGLAAHKNGISWGFTVYPGMGVFVDSFAGLVSDQVTYANWWEFAVNGYNSPLGAAGFPIEPGDRYVFFQNPDAGYPPHGGKLLVVGLAPARGLLPGQTLTVAVVGDDLSKVNSRADATRFETTAVETPEQFVPVAGCTVHVGSRVYHPAGDSFAVSDLPIGTFAIWAEKAMDDSFVYCRSPKVHVNVEAAPKLSAITVAPHTAARGRALKVGFTLSRAGRVAMVVKGAAGRVLYRASIAYRAAGAKSLWWDGRTRYQLGRRLIVTLRATDAWGRRSNPVTLRVPVAR